jgi:hypothetical protein
MASRRPVAVWKGHGDGVLGVRAWGTENLITYGWYDGAGFVDCQTWPGRQGDCVAMRRGAGAGIG